MLAILISKSKLGYVIFKIKEILKIIQKAIVLLLIKRRYFFLVHPVVAKIYLKFIKIEHVNSDGKQIPKKLTRDFSKILYLIALSHKSSKCLS